MSHGQSQEVKATTLLHKAMEYETTHQWRSSQKREDHQHQQAFLCDINLGIYKHI